MKNAWFPRVRGGFLNLDAWGKATCRHSLFVSLNHHLSFLLLGGTTIGWQENHHHAHACTHSPRRAFWVTDGLPTMWIASLFISSHAGWVKRGSKFHCWGSFRPHRLLVCKHTSSSSAPRIWWLWLDSLLRFTQSFVYFSIFIRQGTILLFPSLKLWS